MLYTFVALAVVQPNHLLRPTAINPAGLSEMQVQTRLQAYRDKVASLLGKSPAEVQQIVGEPVSADTDRSFKAGVTWTLSVEGLDKAFADALPTQVHFINGKAEAYRFVVNGHIAKQGNAMASPHPWSLDKYEPNSSNKTDKMFYRAPVNARGRDASPFGLVWKQAAFYLPHSQFRGDDQWNRSAMIKDWVDLLEDRALKNFYGEAQPFNVLVPVEGTNDLILLRSVAAPKPAYGSNSGTGELVGIERRTDYDKNGGSVDASRYVVRNENWDLNNWYFCVYVGRRQTCAGAHPNIPSPDVKSKFALTMSVTELRSAIDKKYQGGSE